MQKVRRLRPDGTRGLWGYVDTGEIPEEKIKRLEKEQLITMTIFVEKHEETLDLKKLNENLQEMNLIALQEVAELNGEFQKLKKKWKRLLIKSGIFLSLKGWEDIVVVYVTLIQNGIYTLDMVVELQYEAVKEILGQIGLDEEGKPVKK